VLGLARPLRHYHPGQRERRRGPTVEEGGIGGSIDFDTCERFRIANQSFHFLDIAQKCRASVEHVELLLILGEEADVILKGTLVEHNSNPSL